MSATGRSDVRRTNDHYVTPDWCVKRLLEAYRPPFPAAERIAGPNATVGLGGTWLDPCAAKGELIRTVRSIRPDVTMMGVELRPECLADLIEATGDSSHAVTGDFLSLADALPDKSVDVILTNVPFALTTEFIKGSVRVAKVSIILLRINAIRGDGRHVLMKSLNPGLFILPQRPSFTGVGTDATEYAFFCFGDPAVAGRWFMLGDTSEEERGRWNVIARALHPEEAEADKKGTE